MINILFNTFFLSLCSYFGHTGVPNMVWTSPKTQNMGEILRGDTAVAIFRFRNMGAEPIVIDNVRTSCGCTASEWDETPVIQGAEGRIKVVFDAVKLGFFQKKMTVWLRNQRKPETLTIEGEVVKK